MGRPPKPVEAKRALGNPGKRRLPAPVVALPTGLGDSPRLPTGLRRDGKAAWSRLWAAGRAWLSPDLDYELLARLCRGYDQAAAYRRVLSKEGLTTKGSTGQVVSHPVVALLRALEAELLRIESLCGFTPADRSRLGLAEVKRVSKLDELLSRQAERRASGQ